MLEKVVLHNYRCFENSEISFRNTAIVVLSKIPRKIELRKNKRPKKDDLNSNGSIPRLSLYKPTPSLHLLPLRLGNTLTHPKVPKAPNHTQT